MAEYSTWNRAISQDENITEEEALAIIKKADLLTGHFGYMGYEFDMVLYSQDGEDEPCIAAVRYKGEWLEISTQQHEHISHELSEHNYEEYTHGGARQGSGRPNLPDEDLKKARSIKFSDTEWNHLKQEAKRQNITASEYIRSKVL